MGAAVRRRQPGAARGRAVVSAWRGWLTRMRRGVRRDRFEAEMADELRTHLEMEAEARQARGAAPDAARREAAIAFGHVESLKESVRDRRAGQWLAQTAQDVRYAVRLLAKWPTFSAVVIGTIALAVCGTATIFSAFDAALLRPLPYAAPDRLVEIVELLDDGSRNSVSAGAFLDWRGNATRLDSAVLMGGVTANLRRGRGAADRTRRRPGVARAAARLRHVADSRPRIRTGRRQARWCQRRRAAHRVALAIALRRRCGHRRHVHHAGRAAAHGHRRRARRHLHRARRAVLRAGGARPGRSRPEGRPLGGGVRAHDAGDDRGPARRRAEGGQAPPEPRLSLVQARLGRPGLRPAGADGARGAAAADRAGRRGDAGAAHRVREHRQPAPGARLAARARGGAACRSRRRQRETGPSAADGERRAGPHRGRRRPRARRARHRRARSPGRRLPAAGDAAETRPARRRFRRARVAADGTAVRRAAGMACPAAEPDRRHAPRRTDGDGPSSGRAGGAGRGPGRVDGGAARRRGSLRPQPDARRHRRSRLRAGARPRVRPLAAGCDVSQPGEPPGLLQGGARAAARGAGRPRRGHGDGDSLCRWRLRRVPERGAAAAARRPDHRPRRLRVGRVLRGARRAAAIRPLPDRGRQPPRCPPRRRREPGRGPTVLPQHRSGRPDDLFQRTVRDRRRHRRRRRSPAGSGARAALLHRPGAQPVHLLDRGRGRPAIRGRSRPRCGRRSARWTPASPR